MTIKELRKRSGKSVMAICQELGIHINTYYVYEAGKAMKPFMVAAFADVFGVEKSEIDYGIKGYNYN